MTTYGILRVYRKKGYCPNVVENIKKMLDAGVDYIVVIVYHALDKVLPKTDIEIRENFSEDRVLVIRSRECSEPTHWAKALNIGIRAIKERFEIHKGDLLFTFSNELTISREVLEAVKSVMKPGVGVVGLKFPELTAESYADVARCTGSFWHLLTLLRFGCFSEKCDKLGGMEDYHLMLLMSYYGIKHAMIEHPGVRLDFVSGPEQEAKEARELEAMITIKSLLHEYLG